MNALTFDPWAALKLTRQTCAPPNRPNVPNSEKLTDAKLGELGGLGGERVPVLKSASLILTAASPEQAAEERADREAIAAEPLLPPPGSPKRDRMDRQHAEVLDGYWHAALQRPSA